LADTAYKMVDQGSLTPIKTETPTVNPFAPVKIKAKKMISANFGRKKSLKSLFGTT
jgi:hypothetical protein